MIKISPLFNYFYLKPMSSSQLVDGKTGELIGYNATNAYSTSGANYTTTTTNYVGGNTYGTTGYVATTTSNYVPATTTTTTNYYGSGSGAVSKEYAVGGGYYTSTAAVPANTTTVTTNAQVVGTTVNTGKEVIKGESRIEYVPFEKKIIEYKDQSKVERVPKKVKKIEYREERKIETIPKEVTVTDYYAVEYLRQYIPQYVPEKRIEYVQVPKKQVRYEYIPVERYIFHNSDKLFTTLTKLWKELINKLDTPPTKLHTKLLNLPPLDTLFNNLPEKLSTLLQIQSLTPLELLLDNKLSTQVDLEWVPDNKLSILLVFPKPPQLILMNNPPPLQLPTSLEKRQSQSMPDTTAELIPLEETQLTNTLTPLEINTQLLNDCEFYYTN